MKNKIKERKRIKHQATKIVHFATCGRKHGGLPKQLDIHALIPSGLQVGCGKQCIPRSDFARHTEKQ